jgi:hypothetical protein
VVHTRRFEALDKVLGVGALLQEQRAEHRNEHNGGKRDRRHNGEALFAEAVQGAPASPSVLVLRWFVTSVEDRLR